MTQKTLPQGITSYDLLKTFAVVFMIIDHTGFFFYLEDNWWRVAGRLCVPVWFFLIGYARSRDTGSRLWIGATVLICGNMIAGLHLLPLNILFTMILIRLLLNPLMERSLRDVQTFWGINALLFFLIIPTSMISEYGTLGIIMAMFGWLIRHQNELKNGQTLRNHYFAFAALTFIATSYLTFGFNQNQGILLAIGTFIVMRTLFLFQPMTFTGLSEKLPHPFVKLLHFTGRYTLEIYVLHLLLFYTIGLFTSPDRFSLFDWTLFYTAKE
ncbi:MAG: hypothetical protein CO093_02460 [Alphaproteobacteria bacterium CG_4_9_14_3_um_filter_47_13]|nr:MAG: hypothetical protein CO093_02460 [Alphaproteobacteria bacterium CG_4_9_14_3_um_filter_47_13]